MFFKISKVCPYLPVPNANYDYLNVSVGGAGGKGTWGKLGCELELPWIDPNDPNYESDSEKADSPKAINGKSNIDLKALVPEMSEEDVRKAVEPLILEYFENSDR